MKIAVTGYAGGLVRDRLVKLGVIPITANILDQAQLEYEITNIGPDVVIHAAALTNVEDCEYNVKQAFEVNVRGTMNVVDACNLAKARIVYLSTCHIYDGKKKPGEVYTTVSRAKPLNTYGFSKWQGGITAISFAYSWMMVTISKLYNSEQFRDRLLNTNTVEVPNFIYRNYTHVNHFCDLLLQAVSFYKQGVINLGTYDNTHQYDFYCRLYDALGLDRRLVFPRYKRLSELIPRPENGALEVSYVGNGLKYSIQDGIELVAEELG